MTAKHRIARTWTVTYARPRLYEVFRRALADGPQEITRRGDTVVMISETEYERLRSLEQAQAGVPRSSNDPSALNDH